MRTEGSLTPTEMESEILQIEFVVMKPEFGCDYRSSLLFASQRLNGQSLLGENASCKDWCEEGRMLIKQEHCHSIVNGLCTLTQKHEEERGS